MDFNEFLIDIALVANAIAVLSEDSESSNDPKFKDGKIDTGSEMVEAGTSFTTDDESVRAFLFKVSKKKTSLDALD